MDIIKRIPRSINPKNIPKNFKNLNKNNPLNQLNLKDISKNTKR